MADGAFPPEVAALSTAMLRTFRGAFSTFDASSEGTIATADLPLALRALSLNPTDRELRALSDELVRGSSAIPFVLFCQIAARLHAAVRTPAAMARLFAQWDPSNSGAITHAAVREVFGKLTPTPLLPVEALDALITYAGECVLGGALWCSKSRGGPPPRVTAPLTHCALPHAPPPPPRQTLARRAW
jgi:Ca2+-binding EF-hand superfamily protein